MYKPYYFLLLFGFLLTSCVPTQDLIYLQNKENNDVLQAVNPVVAKPYRLQINDIVSINIKALDQQLVEMFNPSQALSTLTTDQAIYQQGYSVDDHGNIRLPVLGEVNVLGHTIEETRIKIENQLLEEYFNREANIFVVVKLSGFRYTINGEVNVPGTKTLFSDRVNIMEAIANAQDITITGDRKNVVVLRQSPSGTLMHTLDLTDIKSMQSPYYQLQPNDYIYVRPLPQKSWGTGATGVQSLATVISALTLVSTTILLLTR